MSDHDESIHGRPSHAAAVEVLQNAIKDVMNKFDAIGSANDEADNELVCMTCLGHDVLGSLLMNLLFRMNEEHRPEMVNDMKELLDRSPELLSQVEMVTDHEPGNA